MSAYRATARCPWCGAAHPLSAHMALVAVCKALAHDPLWAHCRACEGEFYTTDQLAWVPTAAPYVAEEEADTWTQ